MSDAHTTHDDHDGPHEGPIKTPKQLILAVVFAFIVPIIVIVLLVEYVNSSQRPAAGSKGLSPEAVAERIAPVGKVEIKDASDMSTLKTGEQVFAAQCTTCHTAGLVGAPKFGDAAAWAPRIKTGFDALVHSAVAGKGQMGPQGGGDFTDFEVARAVVFMANKAGATFAEPSAPAAAASGAAAPATAAAPAPAPAPATTVAAAATPAPAAAPAAATAKTDAVPPLYTQLCQTCHAAGVAGAPKLGDKAAWAPRIAEGMDKIMTIVINGKGAMPPKGGSTASEAELRTVVTYMVNASK
jgi:cytochrome c5